MENDFPEQPVKKPKWRLKIEVGLNVFASRMRVMFLILLFLFVFSWYRLKVGAH